MSDQHSADARAAFNREQKSPRDRALFNGRSTAGPLAKSLETNSGKHYYNFAGEGFTKREIFAVSALQGLLLNAPYGQEEYLVVHAVQLADQLLLALEEVGEQTLLEQKE